MSKRITFASLSLAVVLGAGALLGGSIATSSDAEARGWHGRGHGHFGYDFRHPGRYWGHGGWSYRRAYFGDCFRVVKFRFVPGVGRVARPVTICH